MKRAAEKIRGFTLVELIVVIAVIGILATITVIGFTKFQGDTRDAKRSSSATIITEALEKYYDANGEYPSCSVVSSSDATSLTQNTLKGVDKNTLIAPQAASGTTNSIQCTSAGAVLSVSGADFYEYQGDGSAECNGSGTCLSFVLKYKSEGDNTIKTISSRRTSSIATSGNITDLSANSVNFSTIALSWSAVNNSTSYNIQMSGTSNFSGASTTTSPSASASVGGLSAGVTYYFRVQPVNGTNLGTWSNTAFATTRSLGTPVAKAAVNGSSGTQIAVTWSAIQYATSYRIDRSTSSSFPATSATTSYTQTAVNKTFTDESPGVTHYYRVTALASGDTSDPSATVSATTAVAPAAFSISKTDPQYNIERVTSAATCTAGTTVSYRWYKNDVFWKEGTGSSYKTVDAQFPAWDYTLKVTAQARCITSTYNSPYTGASNNVSRTLSKPTVQVQQDQYRSIIYSGTCPSGTTATKYTWKITGEVDKSGSSTSGQRVSYTSVAWGNGRAYVTLACTSPAPYGWGTYSVSDQAGFGPLCQPMTSSCPSP